MTAAQNRDREKTYNKFDIKKLTELTPEFDWFSYFRGIEVSAQAEVILRQPDYFAAFNKMLKTHSLEDWKTYLTYKLLDGNAPLLNKNFVNLNFSFYFL